MDPSAMLSVAVRDELEHRLERDLLGPWDGPDEELPPGMQPAERYLVGRLVPAAAPPADADDEAAGLAPETVEAEGGSLDEPGDAGTEPVATVRSGSRGASSIGLSFQVPADVDTLRVKASWGRYERGPSEIHETEQGRPSRVWKRVPCGGPVEIDCTVGGEDNLVPDPLHEQVVVRAVVRHKGATRIVDVALINRQTPPSSAPDTARLYQAQLQVTALDGAAAVFAGHNDPELSEPPSTSDDERRTLELLFRHSREYAHGRQCAVDADVRRGDDRAWRLTTTSFPSAEVPLVVPGDSRKMPGLKLDMDTLGSPGLARDDLVRALRPLVTGYRRWLQEEQRPRLDDPEVARYAPAAAVGLDFALKVADRLDRAVDLLRDNGQAREAFRFANQAMALQRVRGEVVRDRLADPALGLDALLRKHNVVGTRSWRPFQLAFVLLCLPGLTDPSHPDALRGPDDGTAQLLFFPTGGGKTEAYLGLTAFTLAVRRLQGVVGTGEEARDGTDGVAVLMRYTLRLLTAQQFQRAASLICACEWLRRERIAGGDGRWGTVPFRLGLWVGVSVTPNTFENARQEIQDKRGQTTGPGGVLQLAACPWCGLALEGSRDVTTDDVRRRVLAYCPDPEGTCPFSERQAHGEGLPVVTTDEELYRLTPALVISTVDKFAQLPWKAATATLFGQVDTRCPRHGWHNPEFVGFCKSRHPAAAGYPATALQPAMRLRPPDLIIQDELHLISDALGSMVGLYETVVDELCTHERDGQVVRPVLVASTATVRRARDQVEQVFARGLTVFPPQVIDAGETFFSTTVEPTAKQPGRRYFGICAPGETLKSVEIRVMAALLEHAQALFDEHGAPADPYMTVVDYFTSTRELAGMRRLVEDDVADRLSSNRVRTRRRRPAVSELTSRMPSAQITSTLAELDRGFVPTYDSTAAMERLRTDPDFRKEAAERMRPVDVLLATSMLQVGVDVPRLGAMVVTGQPKNTAEYIQATSRVGRRPSEPGLVLTIFQWTRPRDLGHYERFGYNHATFGMRVEGVTTTPFSDRALDRALSAVVVTDIRHEATSRLPNPAAHTVPLTGPSAKALVELIGRRAERVTSDQEVADEVRKKVQHRLDRWSQRRTQLPTGKLGYQEAADVAGLLEAPGVTAWDLWTAPMSMREVEEEVLLQIRQGDPSLTDAPAWTYGTQGNA
ncbi:DISARM system helicase DrmA [Actinomycetospora sp. CA-101289]|uniref:DISARM system helicase DrmA n=1 Tax=Actinomycetospora sp. CA-101289 TaxID=3239893 RepID=UPI003D98F338